MFFLKISRIKFSPWGGCYFHPCRGSIAPMYTKIIYGLTIAILYKCFGFQNDWLKIIRIRYSCLQFCPILLSRNSKRMCNNRNSNNRYRFGDNENPKFLGKCRITKPPSRRFALKHNSHISFYIKDFIYQVCFNSVQ